MMVQTNKVKRICQFCSTEFYVYPSEIRKGGGKFCSRSCATTYRNTTDNPSWDEEVKAKISLNHADVSGKKNPMFGKRDEKAPSFIDGRSKFTGETYRRILLASGQPQYCKMCGATSNLQAHHIDGNHNNNVLTNLEWLCVKCHQTVAHTKVRNSLGQFTNCSILNKCEVMHNVYTD